MTHRFITGLGRPGVASALWAALLFGVGTPLAKALLGRLDPWLLAGLLYLGSGLGLTLYRWWQGSPAPRLSRHEWPWLIAAVALGGGLAPVLLMLGLAATPASSASLLLNAEGVFTALLAWFVFRENFDRRIALGMLAIVAGAVILSWPPTGAPLLSSLAPGLWIVGACAAWALDNNLTRKVSLADAAWIASIKGLAAGSANLALALALGAAWPAPAQAAAAMLVGCFAYGMSLALFVVGLRHLGTARTGAYFSLAPFAGALTALPLLGEPLTWPLLAAGALMALGVWLHLSEHHSHEHHHPLLEHEHEHEHDEHHQHEHGPADGAIVAGRHSHWHRHEPLTHSHAHFPDAHHQHEHPSPPR